MTREEYRLSFEARIRPMCVSVCRLCGAIIATDDDYDPWRSKTAQKHIDWHVSNDRRNPVF